MPKLESRIQVQLILNRIQTLAPLFLEKGLGAELALDAVTQDNSPPEAWEPWIERLAGLALSFHAPFLDLSPGSFDPGILAVTRRRLLEAAKLAVRFGAGTMVAHAGYEFRRYPHTPEAWLERSARTWREVLEATEGANLVIALENTYERKPDLIVRLLDLVGHPRLGFCLDAGHVNAFARTSLTPWLEALSPRLVRIHLHDNDGGFDDHLPIGQGNVDFEYLFGWLDEHRISPGLTLELRRVEDFPVSFQALAGLLARHPIVKID